MIGWILWVVFIALVIGWFSGISSVNWLMNKEYGKHWTDILKKHKEGNK